MILHTWDMLGLCCACSNALLSQAWHVYEFSRLQLEFRIRRRWLLRHSTSISACTWPVPCRTYISFDILRRIMVNYFNYDVILTMNITDIDDKIINRSNEAGVPFETLAREQERSFLADMERLGVAPPDVMTRVSEYVPEIIAFVQKIISNGFAYDSNGSVYFDVAAYQRSKDSKVKHTYGKLVPENVGNKAAVEEGEGALSAGTKDKRDGCDFALWKASKPGEPSWDSPWGRGRPGWHIECSAMCGDTLGIPAFANGPIDIHSGGIDLRFPHHDNEIAQSEACYDCAQWVNYFVHSGHLNIEGLKMSKSLKNFIKISDAVERYGARQLRLLFLLQKYNAPMNYSERAMEGVAAIEKLYLDFFDNVKATLRSLPATVNQHWSARDKEFAAGVAKAKEGVRAALADDFNTPQAMSVLSDLLRDTNKYMLADPATGAGPVPLLLKSSADYITYIFRVFGLVDPLPSIGFSASSSSSSAADSVSGASLEQTLAPYLDVLSSFREQIREIARSGGDGMAGRLMALCDALRDDVLPPLGVKLEDGGAAASSSSAAASPDGAAAAASAPSGGRWKLRDPADIKRELDEKRAAADDKARKKAEAAAEVARKAAEKEAKAALDPRQMFRTQTDKYSKWNDDGIPTHDQEGVEIPKAGLKKLQKEWAVQAKLHEWLKAKQAGGAAAAPEPEGDA